MFRVFKARLINNSYWLFDGCKLDWHELAKKPWAHVYRTTGTPCSYESCYGGRYDRMEFKRETRRIIKESMD